MERYGLREDRALHVSCLRFFVVTCIAKMRVCGHCTIVKLGDQPNQEKTSDDTGTMEAPDQSSQQILVDLGPHSFSKLEHRK